MDSCLTTSSVAHYNRHMKRNDYEPIPPRYMAVLSHHLAGLSARQVSELTGYKLPTIYKILSDKRVSQIRQQLLKRTQEEFEALYPKVVEVLREELDSGDHGIRLKATDQWLHASGRYKSDAGGNTTVNLSAEDVVFNILQQGAMDAQG